MKKIKFFLVAFVLLAGLLLTACCDIWNVTESCVMDGVHATVTYGAQQWAIQQTELAK